MHLIRRILITSAIALIATTQLSVYADEKIKVTASFSILGDLARVIGGDRVYVYALVGPNEDAHIFESKPSDAKQLLTSQVFLTNGLGFEPWAQKLAKASGFKGTSITASKSVQARKISGETDPHAWQNPNNVIVYVQNIADGLSQSDPAGAKTYQANALTYIKELKALDLWAKAQFADTPVSKRKVITSHDAFGYLSAQYQVQFLSPQGVNTETEPSAKQVAQLIRQIKRERIKAVFVENMANPKLLAQLSQDAGVVVGAGLYSDALSAADKPGSTYLLMMRHNISQLAAGMRLN
jgi:zinc/manganese transport system substrate-binding protein